MKIVLTSIRRTLLAQNNKLGLNYRLYETDSVTVNLYTSGSVARRKFVRQLQVTSVELSRFIAKIFRRVCQHVRAFAWCFYTKRVIRGNLVVDGTKKAPRVFCKRRKRIRGYVSKNMRRDVARLGEKLLQRFCVHTCSVFFCARGTP